MQDSELELRIRIELERLHDGKIAVREALAAIMEVIEQQRSLQNGPG